MEVCRDSSCQDQCLNCPYDSDVNGDEWREWVNPTERKD